MKTKVMFVILIVLSVVASFSLTACAPKEDELPEIISIEAKLDSTVSYSVGDVFDSSKITVTATLDDETERKVETVAALVFDSEDLLLDSEGKFTVSGTYELLVYYSTFSTILEINVAE
jgi:hypothetical protein